MDTPTELPGVNAPDADWEPTLDVDVATVSVVDGIWQDQPDNVAAFVEARLGALARGRGNLYLCLDVSGEVDGRADIERTLIETLRETYASSRGSISFGLSEALRAANAALYDLNRQVAREMRRMAGVSAVVLRGNDLYVAQAGPAAVYVEAGGRLARYPAESDWFVEDAPLISPQGTASAPLGIRREFVSDLAHGAVTVGDVFVLASRSLTTLAVTSELAIAFTERSAQEIARYLEELGEDADLTALIAEVMDARATPLLEDDEDEDDAHIESLPVPLNSLVPLDESEPPLDGDEELEEEEPAHVPLWGATANAQPETDEGETLDWDAPDAVGSIGSTEGALEDEGEHEPDPQFASAAMALPAMGALGASATPSQPDYAELERRRAEREARRAAQREGVGRAVSGAAGAVMVGATAVGGAAKRTVGAVDWDRMGKMTNRVLNTLVAAVISFILLFVRLILPGAAPTSTKLIPRRATSKPVWLKAAALALPILFIALALGRYMLEVSSRNDRFEVMVAQADTIVKQAEVNPDKTAARTQLSEAMELVTDARALRDSQKARAVLYRIQDQLNEIDGVAVLYFLPTLAQPPNAELEQIVAGDQDIYLLDGRGRVDRFVVNDATGVPEPPVGEEGTLLKVGDKVGETTITELMLETWVLRTTDKGAVVVAANDALLIYDPESDAWSASPVTDAAQWMDLRAIAGFGGNVYLLDADTNQIYRYTPTATGFTVEGSAYFAVGAQPNLDKAVDMAIDGDIWVLQDNGGVLRFRAGTAVPFTLGALSTPLKNPVAIFTRPEVDSLYVADAGNERIVEFDKNGVFVRQYKPYAEKADVFRNLQDFVVNETKRKLYFVNSDAAYMGNVVK